MAHRVVFRPAAERDLAALYAYIRDANGGPEVAISYLRRIRDFCEGLRAFPSAWCGAEGKLAMAIGKMCCTPTGDIAHR